MVMEVKPVQPEKAQAPIEVTELGIIMEVKPVQFPKAASPIKVTEFGIVMDVNPVQFVKAHSPIEVTELGMMYSDSLLPAGNVCISVFSLLNKIPSTEQY